ncbi:ABC transporter permease [Microbacterium resistens]|uniref:ABC transporter permease n=1 Tax=Microbacterium resistens TaxID=156977 RepID=A0ABY3RT26_9MICO|nr:ABC transporter permease [Microbacterium resistens]UGS25627.1 ABC transporter permease [Microbacterium resistens]
MLRYVLKRLGASVVVLFLVSLAVFLLFFAGTPGSIAQRFAGEGADQATIALVERTLGLDRPLPVQYLDWLGRILTFDFGVSFRTQEPVLSGILSRLPATASLAVGAIVLAVLVAVPLGTLAATRPGSAVDRLVSIMALSGLSAPTFLIGLGLFYVLFFQLSRVGVTAFPSGGYTPLTENPWEWFRHLLLPWMTIALVNIGVYARFVRSTMIDALKTDYIWFARAKGMGERRILRRLALKPSLAPLVTLVGLDLGGLLGGTIITERIWGISGIGSFAVNGVMSGDLPVVMGTVMVAALFIILMNLIVDVVYALIDPRVRLR